MSNDCIKAKFNKDLFLLDDEFADAFISIDINDRTIYSYSKIIEIVKKNHSDSYNAIIERIMNEANSFSDSPILMIDSF